MSSKQKFLIRFSGSSKRVAEFLLEQGANIHTRDNDGKEPRDYAVGKEDFHFDAQIPKSTFSFFLLTAMPN